jgi:hypothetical protein
MNLTQLQVEELHQAWKEGMAEIQASGVMQCGIAVHGITREVALITDYGCRQPRRHHSRVEALRAVRRRCPSSVSRRGRLQ